MDMLTMFALVAKTLRRPSTRTFFARDIGVDHGIRVPLQPMFTWLGHVPM